MTDTREKIAQILWDGGIANGDYFAGKILALLPSDGWRVDMEHRSFVPLQGHQLEHYLAQSDSYCTVDCYDMEQMVLEILHSRKALSQPSAQSEGGVDGLDR